MPRSPCLLGTPPRTQSRRFRERDGATHRGLRSHRRHAARRAGGDRRVDRLAVPASLRFSCMLRVAARHGPRTARWAIWSRPSGGLTRHADTVTGSLVLETEFETTGGVVRIVDCMPTRKTHPRIVRIVEGGCAGRSRPTRFAPPVRLRQDPTVGTGGRGSDVAAGAGPEALRLRAGHPPCILRDHGYGADFTVARGGTCRVRALVALLLGGRAAAESTRTRP